MTKSLKERIDENKRLESQAAFSHYVQSIAFNMTLSRSMIEGLEMVRDYWIDAVPLGSAADPDAKSPRLNQHSRTIPIVRALARRGLVWHDYIANAPKGHRYYKLTRAGELMCELLVEAGLLAQAPKESRRKMKG